MSRYKHEANFTEEQLKLSKDGMIELRFYPDKNSSVIEIYVSIFKVSWQFKTLKH